MVLPELAWQFVYSRLAWALVLAVVLTPVLTAVLSLATTATASARGAAGGPAGRVLPRSVLACVIGACMVLMALPGEASPAWHLGLAFQYPSGVLAGLCAVQLHARWNRAPSTAAMPVKLAALLAVAGAVLYLDAFGLFSLGAYYAGFGPNAAPLLAVLLAAACAAALKRRHAGPHGWAVLGAVLLFSLARLPTGNLWDALLDPLLWGWALVALAAAGARALRRRRARLALGPSDTGIKPFLPIKE